MKKILVSFMFLIITSSVFLSGCFKAPEQKLINISFGSITGMVIKFHEDNMNYAITDSDKMKEIYDRFSEVSLQKKEKGKNDALFSSVPNQGKPIYYIHINYQDENDHSDVLSISINLTYTDYWEHFVDKYYLQRRVNSQSVYYKETDINDFNYFVELYNTFKAT